MAYEYCTEPWLRLPNLTELSIRDTDFVLPLDCPALVSLTLDAEELWKVDFAEELQFERVPQSAFNYSNDALRLTRPVVGHLNRVCRTVRKLTLIGPTIYDTVLTMQEYAQLPGVVLDDIVVGWLVDFAAIFETVETVRLLCSYFDHELTPFLGRGHGDILCGSPAHCHEVVSR